MYYIDQNNSKFNSNNINDNDECTVFNAAFAKSNSSLEEITIISSPNNVRRPSVITFKKEIKEFIKIENLLETQTQPIKEISLGKVRSRQGSPNPGSMISLVIEESNETEESPTGRRAAIRSSLKRNKMLPESQRNNLDAAKKNKTQHVKPIKKIMGS